MTRKIEGLREAFILTEPEIEGILNRVGWKEIINRVAETFVEEANSNTVSPPKTIIEVDKYKNDYRVMPSYMLKYPDFIGTKIVSACTYNPEYGFPLAMGTYILNKTRFQIPVLLFDANITTAYRTAAASAVAARELAADPKEPRVLGLVGCGQQSYYHIPAIYSVCENIETVLINDKSKEAEEKLEDHFKDLYDMCAVKKTDVLLGADIVVTLTPTKQPHMFPNNLDRAYRKQVIIAAGGDSESKMEWASQIFTTVDPYCDSLAQVSHTGTVCSAIGLGYIRLEDINSLGDLMVGKKEMSFGKNKKMFFSTGVALQDLAMAILLYQELEKGDPIGG